MGFSRTASRVSYLSYHCNVLSVTNTGEPTRLDKHVFAVSSGTTPTFCLLLIGFPRRQCPINCGLLCASALLPAEGQRA